MLPGQGHQAQGTLECEMIPLIPPPPPGREEAAESPTPAEAKAPTALPPSPPFKRKEEGEGT